MTTTDPLTGPTEGDEYAVDIAPAGDHVDTVLASSFPGAVVTALSRTNDSPDNDFDLFDVTHMASGDQRRVELTDDLRERVANRTAD